MSTTESPSFKIFSHIDVAAEKQARGVECRPLSSTDEKIEGLKERVFGSTVFVKVNLGTRPVLVNKDHFLAFMKRNPEFKKYEDLPVEKAIQSIWEDSLLKLPSWKLLHEWEKTHKGAHRAPSDINVFEYIEQNLAQVKAAASNKTNPLYPLAVLLREYETLLGKPSTEREGDFSYWLNWMVSKSQVTTASLGLDQKPIREKLVLHLREHLTNQFFQIFTMWNHLRNLSGTTPSRMNLFSFVEKNRSSFSRESTEKEGINYPLVKLYDLLDRLADRTPRAELREKFLQELQSPTGPFAKLVSQMGLRDEIVVNKILDDAISFVETRAPQTETPIGSAWAKMETDDPSATNLFSFIQKQYAGLTSTEVGRRDSRYPFVVIAQQIAEIPPDLTLDQQLSLLRQKLIRLSKISTLTTRAFNLTDSASLERIISDARLFLKKETKVTYSPSINEAQKKSFKDDIDSLISAASTKKSGESVSTLVFSEEGKPQIITCVKNAPETYTLSLSEFKSEIDCLVFETLKISVDPKLQASLLLEASKNLEDHTSKTISLPGTSWKINCSLDVDNKYRFHIQHPTITNLVLFKKTEQSKLLPRQEFTWPDKTLEKLITDLTDENGEPNAQFKELLTSLELNQGDQQELGPVLAEAVKRLRGPIRKRAIALTNKFIQLTTAEQTILPKRR